MMRLPWPMALFLWGGFVAHASTGDKDNFHAPKRRLQIVYSKTPHCVASARMGFSVLSKKMHDETGVLKGLKSIQILVLWGRYTQEDLSALTALLIKTKVTTLVLEGTAQATEEHYLKQMSAQFGYMPGMVKVRQRNPFAGREKEALIDVLVGGLPYLKPTDMDKRQHIHPTLVLGSEFQKHWRLHQYCNGQKQSHDGTTCADILCGKMHALQTQAEKHYIRILWEDMGSV